MNNPSKLLSSVVERIMRYIDGTTPYGILYEKISGFKLTGYSDSDWGGSVDDRRSTSRNLFTLGSHTVT